MKKISIKILATILVAILMLANFSFVSTVVAATNGYTQDDAINWVNSILGQTVGTNDTNTGECVGLISKYYEFLGQITPSYWQAKELAYQANNQPAGWQTLQGAQPQKGDILIYYCNSCAGHVAIYESDYVTYHQNYSGKFVQKVEGVYYQNARKSCCYYWGVVRPDFATTPKDTEGPKISDIKVSKDQEGYTITCTVTDNVGVTRVQFPTVVKKADGTETEKFWGQGTIDGNTATFRMLYSHFGITDGTYVTQILANDAEENYSEAVTAVEFVPDVEAPVISNVKVTNVTGTSYTLTFEVDDNVGVTKVQCPTWNEDNDRDEMEGIDWGTDPAYTAIEKAGVYTYTVNIDNDTFKNEGGEYRTQITAYDEYGNVTKEDINVDVYPVTDVTLNETEKTIYKGQELVLEATYEPIYTTGDTEIVWTSSDEEVATVEDGVVTALKEGTTTITAEVDGVKATCEITVEEIPLEGIAIEEQNVSLNIGEEKDLHVLFNPENTTDDKTVVWTSSDESVVTISEDGKVKALKAGKATITATVGDKTATTEITVNEEVTETEESNSVLPKTGDMQVVALAIGMLVSILGIAFIIKKNRK